MCTQPVWLWGSEVAGSRLRRAGPRLAWLGTRECPWPMGKATHPPRGHETAAPLCHERPERPRTRFRRGLMRTLQHRPGGEIGKISAGMDEIPLSCFPPRRAHCAAPAYALHPAGRRLESRYLCGVSTSALSINTPTLCILCAFGFTLCTVTGSLTAFFLCIAQVGLVAL
jgi:hypothetical protein